MFETRREGDTLCVERLGTDWLSTGWRGGRRVADRAYSLTVEADWRPDDVESDVADRLAADGFDWDADEPVLVTCVDAENVVGARLDPVEAYATVGLSNPAALPMNPSGGDLTEGDPHPGTVNLVVGTTAELADGALANLVSVAAEAKAATLLSTTGVPGTTTDAVVVASDPRGPHEEFSGSATAVGAAARACVREAVRAGLAARYDDDEPPSADDEAAYGVRTDVRADVFRP